MTTPTMCEANCGSTCYCDWEEVLGTYDDDMFLDKGLKHLTNAVYYQTHDGGGYAVVGRDVYEVKSDWFSVSATLLNGTLLVRDKEWRVVHHEVFDDKRWMELTLVKFVPTSLPAILKG